MTNGFIAMPVSIASHSGILKWSKQKEIIGEEIGTVGKVGHSIPLGGRLVWFDLVWFGRMEPSGFNPFGLRR
jgi:hypothetical protein